MRALLYAALISVPTQAGVVVVPPSSFPAYSAPTLQTSVFPTNTLPSLPLLCAPLSLTPTLSAPSLNIFWDGFSHPSVFLEDFAPAAASLAGISDEPLVPERGYPWLALDDPKAAAALDRALDLASTTKAGRKALDEAEKILFAQGRVLPVLVQSLGRNFGEYDYVAKKMSLHKDLFLPGREADLAGTVVHELTHVVQHTQGVPGNALEMEIEAHLQDLQMLQELGLEPPPHTFARQLYVALRKGPAEFIALIQAAVPGTVFLGDASFEDIDEQMEQDLEDQNKLAKHSKSAAGLARAIEADMDLLRTPTGRASYKAFSKRVLALLKRRAAEAT